MNCEKCGAKGKVVNSRNSSDTHNSHLIPDSFKLVPRPFVYRDHKCKKCSATYQSVEILASSLKDMKTKITNKVKDSIVSHINEFT